MRNIPNSLRRYRRGRGMKQKEVAKLLGIKSASMISRWENGASLPSTENVFRLSVIYRTMVDALYMDYLTRLKDEIRKREEILAIK
jgi:transcriptional regulator with XRE-family HTH domain